MIVDLAIMLDDIEEEMNKDLRTKGVHSKRARLLLNTLRVIDKKYWASGLAVDTDVLSALIGE